MKEEYFRQDAKAIVDMLFDADLFRAEVTRDHMATVETFLSDCLQMRFDTYKRMSKFLDQVKEHTEKQLSK